MQIHVEIYLDPGGIEKIRRFRFDGREIDVIETIDQWHGAGYRYAKVRARDGSVYILRHDEVHAYWELTMFQNSG